MFYFSWSPGFNGAFTEGEKETYTNTYTHIHTLENVDLYGIYSINNKGMIIDYLLNHLKKRFVVKDLKESDTLGVPQTMLMR